MQIEQHTGMTGARPSAVLLSLVELRVGTRELLGGIGVIVQVQSIYMYVGIEENLTKPPTTSGQLLVRLHYREMDILLNHGIRLDF